MIFIPATYAHCDIPCKVYDPFIAQFSALSVIRFLDIIAEIEDDKLNKENISQLSRVTTEKETHAHQVKTEIATIWGDYFKANHIEKYPEIHDLVHSIMSSASKCKQGLERENGIELLDKVNKFASIYWESKEIKTCSKVSVHPPNLSLIMPVLNDS